MDYLEDNSSKMLKELRILVGAIRGPAAQQVFPQCFNVSTLAAVTLQRLEFFIPLSCNSKLISAAIGSDSHNSFTLCASNPSVSIPGKHIGLPAAGKPASNTTWPVA